MHAINRYLVGVVGVSVVLAMFALTPVVGPAEANNLKTWDKAFADVNKRFKLRMGGAAVLDKETGLVWEQSPLTTTHTWSEARFQCIRRGTGGRMGWRLPSIPELTSLVVPGNPAGDPDLPAGHPFESDPGVAGVQSDVYWSATTDAGSSGNAWDVSFVTGSVLFSLKTTDTSLVWCVRGGMNADAY